MRILHVLDHSIPLHSGYTFRTAAILREQGIPARTRVGFATYFTPRFNEDHWICEYWDPAAGRWIAVDAQLDAFQRGKLRIRFDPLDLPKGRFIYSGEAWQACMQACFKVLCEQGQTEYCED